VAFVINKTLTFTSWKRSTLEMMSLNQSRPNFFMFLETQSAAPLFDWVFVFIGKNFNLDKKDTYKHLPTDHRAKIHKI
jgi:hypothetical protein